MKKPDDIPQDVWEAAIEALRVFLRDERCGAAVRFGMVGRTLDAAAEAVARALMAERSDV